jgi:hypothetical protein
MTNFHDSLDSWDAHTYWSTAKPSLDGATYFSTRAKNHFIYISLFPLANPCDLACNLSTTRVLSSESPITVAALSTTWTVFASSNTVAMGSNPTLGMDVCVHLFYVRVVLCVGRSISTDWSPFQGVLPTVCRIKKLKIEAKAQHGLQSHW